MIVLYLGDINRKPRAFGAIGRVTGRDLSEDASALCTAPTDCVWIVPGTMAD